MSDTCHAALMMTRGERRSRSRVPQRVELLQPVQALGEDNNLLVCELLVRNTGGEMEQ